MFGLSWTRLALAAVVGLALSPVPGVGADVKRVQIPTFDGVKLEGNYYPNPAGKKDACVLLLHHFDPRKGGDSHSDGWDQLAEALQNAGYVVLSFDFRGFGQSKTLDDPAKFWMNKHNREFVRGGEGKDGKLSETIDQKKFTQAYYPYLINDIAAAKAFLDRKNDLNDCNSSNLVVIGAGDGATLGAMWLVAMSRLQRDRAPMLALQPQLDEPEIKDVAAAVWLSLSPNVAGRSMPLKAAHKEVGRECKVPMAFLYGSKDANGSNIAKALVKEIRNGKDLPLTGDKGFDTELGGSKLLQGALKTEDWIIKDYLDKVIEKRGSRERKVRESEKCRFFWAFPRPGPGARLIPAKMRGVENLDAIPLDQLIER
jgi:alpha-beta hydrolase superfamily lysophospholipase